MIRIEMHDITPGEAEILSQFWRGGFGRAEGFRINTAPADAKTYQSPKSKRALAEEIIKAIKREKAA